MPYSSLASRVDVTVTKCEIANEDVSGGLHLQEKLALENDVCAAEDRASEMSVGEAARTEADPEGVATG